jgi:AcrR family transcriptional regulator
MTPIIGGRRAADESADRIRPNDAIASIEHGADHRTVRAIEQLIGSGDMAIEARYDEILAAARDVIARRGFHQAPIREIARAAGLSLAGLYHYVGSKDELLFLLLDRSLDRLIGALDRACEAAETPEERLLALIRTHLAFGFHEAPALKIINRDYELLDEPRRAEVASKRQAYLQRGIAILRELDRRGRSGDELLSDTNLLLGMLNGIATRPFLRTADDVRHLAAGVASLFLHGFLDTGAGDGAEPAAVPDTAPARAS